MNPYNRVGLILILGIITGMSLTGMGTAALAVDNEVTRSTLGGLKGVYLHVPPLSTEAEKIGLSSGQVLRDMKRQLDRAGIPLISDSEYDRLKASKRYPLARIEVYVAAYELDEPKLIIYSIKVEVRQAMLLIRKPVVKMVASTWSKEQFGNTPDLDEVRGKLRELMDDFIDAYFSVNPR